MPSALAAPVKAVRDGAHVFLNDGVYGSLFEMPMIGVIDRIVVLAPEGVMREGTKRDFIVFGPTCDSVDRLPGELSLASDIAEGDYVMFGGHGGLFHRDQHAVQRLWRTEHRYGAVAQTVTDRSPPAGHSLPGAYPVASQPRGSVA